MDLRKQLGYYLDSPASIRPDPRVIQYINLKLAVLGQPVYRGEGSDELHEIAAPLLAIHREKDRLLADYLCPADRRIHDFLTAYLGADFTKTPVIPEKSFTLDRHGLARVLSLPPEKDYFRSPIVESYRVRQGVLHNPETDRRTTKGVFHIASGGLPVPADKKETPKEVFAELLHQALRPPQDLLRLPFTSNEEEEAHLFVSLLLRPIVCPKIPGIAPEKSMEVRFFAPGSLVCNLDFVESIFGNAGDPFLPENDAALDAEHWTGHTGCVILAPHLTKLTKKQLGLPRASDATERQRRDGMCWESEDELYNDGEAFKVTCRDERGVMVTLIADNYFGYCKKEVKTQISYAANLMGGAEEEHAGGALAFPSYDLGDDFLMYNRSPKYNHTFKEVVDRFGDLMHVMPEGYGVDKKFPNILYVPEDARFNLRELEVSWTKSGKRQKIRLVPRKVYVRPSGYKVRMIKLPGQTVWRLVGTVAEGTFCHKPSTVSGGGKSEISKPITDALLHGPVMTANITADLDQVQAILDRSYDDRFREGFQDSRPSRAILSSERSLGSVIKLLTPSKLEYTEEYNAWLESIPNYIKELVFIVKRFYQPEWGDDWRSHFSVDFVNGQPGHELRCDGYRLIENYVRVGFEEDGSWRVFSLRSDFIPAAKLQMEDDITASTVIASHRLNHLNSDYASPSVKLVANCEYRLFQRPDDAIIPGYDKQAERDFAQPTNFLSNYEPLRPADAVRLMEDAVEFDRFSPPMQNLIREASTMTRPDYFCCPAFPRVIHGKPSRNPRYLQDRPDLIDQQETWLAEVGARLLRRTPLDQPLHFPVNAVLPGRRNNPPDGPIRSLAVFNPIHYMELPELFIEYIASLTGKSPSTTGAGSEGALTKGPFNALLPITDLNNALVAAILTGHHGFVTAAGYIGPRYRFDHDISLMVPEIWCRMSAEEQDPAYLIRNRFLERVEDFEYEGKKVPASRLGYRITPRFVNAFFGRVFTNPSVVFTEEMLRPERQDLAVFVDGINNIVETGRGVAEMYCEDGSIDLACPPLRALIEIMAGRNADDAALHDRSFRALFTREYLLASDWYAKRLKRQQEHDIALCKRHIAAIKSFLASGAHQDVADRCNLDKRLAATEERLARSQSDEYLTELIGSLGRDEVRPPRHET